MALRSFHHSAFTAERIAAEREVRVSVCLPARECAETVGEIVARLERLHAEGVLDEIVVVDAASPDGTAAVAERAGARVVQESELLPAFGPVLGKGDAMWRALSVLSGEVVVYLDADSAGFSERFATGLIGPLVCQPAGGRPAGAGGAGGAENDRACASGSCDDGRISFVKAFYRRPFEHGGVSVPDGGGRVNRLMARPALRAFFPELSGVRQPLAGEVAARRELLERIPFVTGYGVEIAMLIDVWRQVGLGSMAQVDLEEHRNRHQPLADLEGMAEAVLATVMRRRGLHDGGRAPAERPPLADLVTR